MVLMQLLLDSLSQCLGNPGHHQSHDGQHGPQEKDRETPQSFGAQPLGASVDENPTSSFIGEQQLQQQPGSQSKDDSQRQQSTKERRKLGYQQVQRRISQQLKDPKWDNILDSISNDQRGPTCCYDANANPIQEDDHHPQQQEQQQQQYTNGYKAEMDSKVKSIRNGRKRQKPPSLPSPSPPISTSTAPKILSSSSSSNSQSDALRKAREKSSKRKLDIFRTEPIPKRSTSTSSFASRLLGSESSFHTGAILCFANPIFDSDDNNDNDRRLYRSDNDRDGEETVTSTLFFDTKYEHVVENLPLMPLFQDQVLRLDEHHTDGIVKLFESGCIKHEIKSIVCGKKDPSPLLLSTGGQARVGSKSMADSTSEVDDDDCGNDQGYQQQHHHHDTITSSSAPNNHIQPRHYRAQSYKSDDGFVSLSASMQIPPPPPPPKISFTHPPSSPSSGNMKEELEVISDCGDRERHSISPSLKLMNNPTSSTQALTPTNSSSDAHISPKKSQFAFYDQTEGSKVVMGEI
jgi:hypothetical protein